MEGRRGEPGHVLVAPDKFKGSLTALKVAAGITAGLHSVLPGVKVVQLPVADGGDGTVDAAVAAGFKRVSVRATGPTGNPVHTSYARRGDLAVIELASICGLQRLPYGRKDPLRAGTFGLGEVVRAAAARGCRRVVLGIGGSASTDGGAGFLQALGARVLDARGSWVPRGGAALVGARSLDLTPLATALRGVSFVVASDVSNPLCGPNGAAAVYGPQKGASADDVALLDDALENWASLVASVTGADHRANPGAGAAGGVGFAALAAVGAQLRPGIEIVLELVGFADKLPGCRLVITGEGSLDEQTLAGKAPAGVAAATRSYQIPTVAVAGHNTLPLAALQRAGISQAYSLTDIEPDVARCIAEAGSLVERTAADVARDWLVDQPRAASMGHTPE
jgi:glycerate kinase